MEGIIKKAIVAEEMKTVSPHVYAALLEVLADVSIETVSHVDFKRETAVAKAIVRTGEFTPYANVILVAGA